MADDQPLHELDSSVYQPVENGEPGPSGERGDDITEIALSHPPFFSAPIELGFWLLPETPGFWPKGDGVRCVTASTANAASPSHTKL